ncbi:MULTISPECIES: fluoride efflux transporter CrcB [Methylomonas]|uniref:fluoride efflux transporter CrcB n=1 Tax=Methylomonas TaxID=416 RepID=UPI001231C894
MQQLFAIAVGGSLGAVARFLVANGVYAALGRSFPHGTLFVNVVGSLLIGVLTELMVHRFALAIEYRAAVLVGFLGAFTTFSTFALETLYLFEEGSYLKALLNIFLSVVLCLSACWVGLIWGRILFSEGLSPWVVQYQTNFGLMLGFLGIFFLSLCVELLFHYFNAAREMRAIFFISLLSGLTMASTLWFGLRAGEVRMEFQGLLSLFVVNTLLGVATIWSGYWVGNWVWQLGRLSQ